MKVLPVEDFEGMSIRTVWGALDEASRSDLVKFWLQQGAITDPAEAARRTGEVVCLVRDAAGQVAGVSSAYLGPLGDQGGTYWFYRTFVRPDCRRFGLAQRVFRATVQCLSRVAADFTPCPLGMAVLTDNLKLDQPSLRKTMLGLGLRRIGSTRDGKGVWKLDF